MAVAVVVDSVAPFCCPGVNVGIGVIAVGSSARAEIRHVSVAIAVGTLNMRARPVNADLKTIATDIATVAAVGFIIKQVDTPPVAA